MDEGFTYWEKFSPLDEDLYDPQSFPHVRPLLAHYTSIPTLERILAINEIWLSNPLYMNDIEEVRFGIQQGVQLFFHNEAIREACGTKERYTKLYDVFNIISNVFLNEHVLDVYLFCLSEHQVNNNDGLLSMWRGYGGNGNGAALVIDTNKLTHIASSPLVIVRVDYSSTETRIQWINNKLNQFAILFKKINVPDEHFFSAAVRLFNRIKLYALLTKHSGFSEEKEWRIIYLKERDVEKRFESMFDYAVGNRGLEPKLKLKIDPNAVQNYGNGYSTDVIDKIILGPSFSHPLAKGTMHRMLEKVGKPELKDRVVASTIPYRNA